MSNEHTSDDLRKLVRNALERRRQGLAYLIARKIFNLIPAIKSDTVEIDSSHWTRIESLSQLRAIVGGRFQNLKERWVAAGFPLRQHRGDRAEDAEVNKAGWVELCVWVNKQGYEVRMADPDQPWLFEIRPSGRSQ